jgi:hypothetical protein
MPARHQDPIAKPRSPERGNPNLWIRIPTTISSPEVCALCFSNMSLGNPETGRRSPAYILCTCVITHLDCILNGQVA